MRRAALALLAAAFAVTLLPGPWGDERVSDLFLYRNYAAAFLDGALPFRDVGFEYPPLAAPLIALPGVASTGEEGYRLAFAGLALAMAVAAVLLTGALAGRTGGDRRTAMLAVAAAPLLTGAMIRTHFDLAPVALTLTALLLICARRPRAGFAVLAIAVMTKGFPIVVAPVALAWLAAGGARREAWSGAISFVLTGTAVAAVAVAISASGSLDAVTYQLDRPVQLESSPASVLLGLDGLGAGTAESLHSHRSDGLVHPADGAPTALFTIVLAGTVALCAAAAAGGAGRGGSGSERALVLGSLAAVAAFAVLGKVLSPQFLIWVAPLGALALAWRMPALAAACAAAIALTLVEFPVHYGDIVAREAPWLWLVAARNALLAAAVVLALLSPARTTERAAARSPSPGRPGRRRPAPR